MLKILRKKRNEVEFKIVNCIVGIYIKMIYATKPFGKRYKFLDEMWQTVIKNIDSHDDEIILDNLDTICKNLNIKNNFYLLYLKRSYNYLIEA